MEGKKRSFTFQTKTIYFPPLKKKVNILLQQRDGPCMLIAIFNSLVLKGKISIECGVYSSSSIISTIQNCDIDAYDLEKLLHGYYVNPSFKSCTEFEDYPDFLSKLDIKMVHAMVPSKKHKNYNIIKKYTYDSMIMKIIELQSSSKSSDELKVLSSWYSKLNKQLTSEGIKEIESKIQEGEVQIFFRNSHFACIYKHLNTVYSLITYSQLAAKNCVWHSLPSSNGEFQYFDQNFNLTYCKPWTEAKQSKEKTKEKQMKVISASKQKVSSKHKKVAKSNECTIY